MLPQEPSFKVLQKLENTYSQVERMKGTASTSVKALLRELTREALSLILVLWAMNLSAS